MLIFHHSQRVTSKRVMIPSEL